MSAASPGVPFAADSRLGALDASWHNGGKATINGVEGPRLNNWGVG
jgi:hypothetical protein